MHRVFIPGAEPPSACLSASEAHHAVRVLRLGVGAAVVVFDGAGREWSARVSSITRGVTVELAEPRVPVAEPPVAVTLGVGLLKGAQMDAVVRDATMLGVTTVVPVSTARTVVPLQARGTRVLERWSRVAIASAKQCGRAVVPSIGAVTPLRDLVEGADASVLKLICVEPRREAGRGPGALTRPRRALVLVGPEGGWSDEEVAWVLGEGARHLDLGPRTLRAETVPAVALSTLWTSWGWR